jgi:hypothetical protein
MTPLLRRIVQENRAAVFALAAILVANVLALVLVVRPLRAKALGASDRAAAASTALASAQAELNQADGLVKGKARADEELDAFYRKVLPSDLTAARRMTYASLPALARKTGVRYAARTTEVESVDRDRHLQKMSIRMVVQGDYDRLRQFIYALESSPDFVIIDDVTLSEASGTNEPLSLTVEMSTFYRQAGNGS